VSVEEILRAVDAGKLVTIVGPTASGKSDLAVRVAERVGGEIVSADSVQVYRAFDIGSGKPSPETVARAPHHLVSIRDPMDAIDAARFAELADAALRDVRTRGKVPIVAGGTFLWVKALLQGLVEAPPASEEVRSRHRAITLEEGRAGLHARLAAVDPEAAARLHPNDAVRVSRALEVFELLGERMSEKQAEHAFRMPRYDSALFAVERSSEELTARIELRASEWLEGGWIEETRELLARGYGDARAMGSVGYREVAAYLRGEIARADLLGAVVRSTRVFARRQRTWLNHEAVSWVRD